MRYKQGSRRELLGSVFCSAESVFCLAHHLLSQVTRNLFLCAPSGNVISPEFIVVAWSDTEERACFVAFHVPQSEVVWCAVCWEWPFYAKPVWFVAQASCTRWGSVVCLHGPSAPRSMLHNICGWSSWWTCMVFRHFIHSVSQIERVHLPLNKCF